MSEATEPRSLINGRGFYLWEMKVDNIKARLKAVIINGNKFIFIDDLIIAIQQVATSNIDKDALIDELIRIRNNED